MSLTLIKEDGSGLATANSYASAADGDTYHEGHLYATDWSGATTAQKEAALVMATRIIDASYQFLGSRKSNTQALQWPREMAIDPDRRGIRASILESVTGPYFDSDTIPPPLFGATCEQARELIKADRTADPMGEGIIQMTMVGSLSITFDRNGRIPILSHLVQSMLAKLGTLLQTTSGTSKLLRT